MKPALLWPIWRQDEGGYLVSVPRRSLYMRCLLATQATIQSLSLAGISTDNIVLQKVPWARDFTQGLREFPGILVTPSGAESMPITAGTNQSDEVVYPVQVTILAADNAKLSEMIGTYLLWREAIAQAFRHRRLDGVNEVYDCWLQPQHVVALDASTKGLFQSSMVLQFVARELRN